MKNGNLIALQSSELDAVSGGAASVISAGNNVAVLLNGLGLGTPANIVSSTLTTAGKALPPLAAPVSLPNILSAVGDTSGIVRGIVHPS